MRLATMMSAGLAGTLALSSVLLAQQPTVTPSDTPGAPVARVIDVAVTYGFVLPIRGDDLAGQAKSLESARRMLYELAANECDLMRATFAASCRLERFNVTSNVQRHGPGQEMAQVGANAAYKVGLKAGH